MHTYKILICHNRYQIAGGEENIVQSEMDLLKSRGHEVDLCQVTNDRLVKFWDKLKVAYQITYSKSSKKYISSRIDSFRPDIVHVHNFFPLLTPSIYDACREKGVPVIQTLHNYRTICAGAFLMRKGRICEKCIKGSPYQGAIHRCYRHSLIGSFSVARMVAYHRKKRTWNNKVDCFIANMTNFAKSKFVEAGFPERKIFVKPNFIDIEEKKQNKTNVKRGGALYVGRLSPEKGIRTLLKAWSGLNIPLRIAGEGPLMNEIKSSSPPIISLLGRLSTEQVMQEMDRAAFLVMPSEWYEGFPRVLIESFANGLPVVASRLGAMAEVVKKGETGLHFEAGNPQDLAQKVLWMYEHPGECQQMGTNAYAFYENNYTPGKNYEMLINIYKEIIDKYSTSKNT